MDFWWLRIHPFLPVLTIRWKRSSVIKFIRILSRLRWLGLSFISCDKIVDSHMHNITIDRANKRIFFAVFITILFDSLSIFLFLLKLSIPLENWPQFLTVNFVLLHVKSSCMSSTHVIWFLNKFLSKNNLFIFDFLLRRHNFIFYFLGIVKSIGQNEILLIFYLIPTKW